MYEKKMENKTLKAEKLRPKTPQGHPCGAKVKHSLRQKLSARKTFRVLNDLAPEPDCDL